MISTEFPVDLPSTTHEQFIDGYRRFDRKSVPGEGNTHWLQHGKWAVMRFPAFHLSDPSRIELRRVFRAAHLPIASFIRPVQTGERFNSYLYVRSKPYAAADLERKPRQSINRAKKYLSIAYLSWDELEQQGLPVFADTRSRVGLSDGIESVFRREIGFFRTVPGHTAFGAWREGRLVAFFVGAHVDDYYTLCLTCSSNESLKWCPNNWLYHAIFDYYLNVRDCRLVSAGLSSVQQGSSWENLHKFKLHVGFDAQEVRRCFSVNPWFKPFINHFCYQGVKGLLKLLPGNPLIRKGKGVYEVILGIDRDKQENVS